MNLPKFITEMENEYNPNLPHALNRFLNFKNLDAITGMSLMLTGNSSLLTFVRQRKKTLPSRGFISRVEDLEPRGLSITAAVHTLSVLCGGRPASSYDFRGSEQHEIRCLRRPDK